MIVTMRRKANSHRRFKADIHDDGVTLVEMIDGVWDASTTKTIKHTTFKNSYRRIEEEDSETQNKGSSKSSADTLYWKNHNTGAIITTEGTESAPPGYEEITADEYRAEWNKLKNESTKEETQRNISPSTENIATTQNIKKETETKEDTKETTGDTQKAFEALGWNTQKSSELPENSMRSNRDAKVEGAIPFVPNPYFLRQSMLTSYIQCPDKFYDIYENGLHEESKFTKMGTAVHGVLEDYYSLENPDVDELFKKWWASHGADELGDFKDSLKMVKSYLNRNKKKPNIIALEFEFQTNIGNVPVSGTIDRIDRIDENTIQIIDYKTNHRPFTRAELEESIQFQMYTLAVMQSDIKKQIGDFDRVICTYEMLRVGYAQSIEFTAEALDEFAMWLESMWNKILSGVDRKPRLNEFCGYCVKRANCEVYTHYLNDVDEVDVETENIAELIDKRETYKNQEKLLKSVLRDIDERIKGEISKHNGELEIGDRLYSTTSQARVSYDSQDVIRILAMNGYSHLLADVVSVKPGELRKLMKSDENLAEQLDEVKQINYTSPSITSRKIKK